MTLWRLLGTLPMPRSREELRKQEIDGWKPWAAASQILADAIVVPHPTDARRSWHIRVNEATWPSIRTRWAAQLDENNIWWFFVPAEVRDVGAFEALEPQGEGHWRERPDEASELPWPEPVDGWGMRAAFVEALAETEAVAERVAYRGLSHCRICKIRNGYEAFRLADWEWPAGYRHYVEQHGIRPSSAFERFIMARRAEEPKASPAVTL